MLHQHLVKRSFSRDEVKVVKNLVPAHDRYYKILGVALKEETDPVTGEGSVLVGVYGPLPRSGGIGMAIIRRESANRLIGR